MTGAFASELARADQSLFLLPGLVFASPLPLSESLCGFGFIFRRYFTVSSRFVLPATEFPPLKDIDDDLCVNIGRIIVKHSYLELVLSRIVYLLAEVKPEIGRVAVREPRTSDRLAMIEDLALIRGLSFDEEAIKLLRTELPNITKFRDQLAHGIFFQNMGDERISIRIAKGTWTPPEMKRGKIKSVIHPRTEVVTTENLADFVPYLDAATAMLERMYVEVERWMREQRQELP